MRRCTWSRLIHLQSIHNHIDVSFETKLALTPNVWHRSRSWSQRYVLGIGLKTRILVATSIWSLKFRSQPVSRPKYSSLSRTLGFKCLVSVSISRSRSWSLLSRLTSRLRWRCDTVSGHSTRCKVPSSNVRHHPKLRSDLSNRYRDHDDFFGFYARDAILARVKAMARAWHIDHRNVLSTYYSSISSERDKLDGRRSIKLTYTSELLRSTAVVYHTGCDRCSGYSMTPWRGSISDSW